MTDLIIIGAGPAGISAAIYAVRAGINTEIIHNNKSSLHKAALIQNYYGNKTSGEELYNYGINQAKELGAKITEDEVTEISYNGNFSITTSNGETISSKALIIAVGTKKAAPNIKGLKEFEGKGVSYCAVCDAFFYRNKKVAIIGAGAYAKSEALVLNNLCDVTILLNGKETKETFDNKIINKEIAEIIGDKIVTAVKFKDGTKELFDGIFIAEGSMGAYDFAKKLGLKTEAGNIITQNTKTAINGLFCCGDCTGKRLQIAKAVNEGMEAGFCAINFLKEMRK